MKSTARFSQAKANSSNELAREMAQCVRCLLFKNEDLGWNPVSKNIRFFFFHTWGCIKRKLNTSFPAISNQKLTNVDHESELHTLGDVHDYTSSCWCCGGSYTVQSVLGVTYKVFPLSKVLWLTAQYTCCSMRGVPVVDQGELEKGHLNLLENVLCMPI